MKLVVDCIQGLCSSGSRPGLLGTFLRGARLPACIVLFHALDGHSQPVLLETRTSTNTDNVPFVSFAPSDGTVWGTSGHVSKVPGTPPFKAIGSRQTTDSTNSPSFQLIATNELSLQPGVPYAVQVTSPTSGPEPPPDDLIVSVSINGVTNSTLPATTTAFSTDGTNRWVTLGSIIPSDANPVITFGYVSGSIGISPRRRFYAQCVRYIPQSQTNAARIWTGGAGSSDRMWNNPTNWNGAAPLLSGDDIRLSAANDAWSIPDGPFAVNSLTFLAGSGAMILGTNYSGPLTFSTTNGIANLSTNDQLVTAAIEQGNVPLVINTGTRTLLFSNSLAGNAGYEVHGAGTLYLRTPGTLTNPITGPVIVHSGATLALAKQRAIGATSPGAGDVVVAGGTLRNDDTAPAMPFLPANRNLVIGPGGATLDVPNSGQYLIYDGVISNSTGNGSLVKTGGGRLTLTGIEPNVFTGPTTAAAGRLILSKSSGNAISGDLFVTTGIVQLTDNDQIADGSTVTVSGGLLGLTPFITDLVGKVVLDGGSITGAVSTLIATNFDFRAGTNSANLAGDGNFLKTSSGTVLLQSDNSYAGSTTVAEGTLLLDGTLGAGPVTVTGATLAGSGTINGPVEIQSGGLLSPGVSIGTLNVMATLTLQTGSITFTEINALAGTSDLIAGLSSVTFGGTLIVTNLSGALQTNASFKLFDSLQYDGTFAAFALPALPMGLAWDTSGLTNDGTLTVIEIGGPLPQPGFVNVALSASGLLLSGAGGASNGVFHILTATNISLPLTNWSPVLTGAFDANGLFVLTNQISFESAQRFFVIQQP